MTVLLRKRITHYLTMLTVVSLITACVSTPTAPEDIPPTLFSELEAGSAYYLNKDQQLGSDDNLAWQFLAIQALIKEDQFIMADAVIASLQEKQLTATQQAVLGLLIADKFYAQNKLRETQTALNAIDAPQLGDTDLIHYLTLQTVLYISNENAQAASDTLLLLTPLITDLTEKQHYHDQLLAQLILLPIDTLTQFEQASILEVVDTEVVEEATIEAASTVQEEATPPTAPNNSKKLIVDQTVKQAWYSLAALYQRNQLRPNRLTRDLQAWQINYPTHPANLLLPTPLTNISAFSPYQPDHVAVILPLSGRFETPGKAIQLGLLNAFYLQQKKMTESIDSDPKRSPTLHFYDTQTLTSTQIAEQLQVDKIDFVIGPLMKSEIESLLPLLGKIPVLALNSVTNQTADKQAPEVDASVETESDQPVEEMSDNDESTIDGESESGSQHSLTLTDNRNTAKNVAWHYAFPLSPEDEARQAAQFMQLRNHKNPLVIAPNSDYGKRVAEAFQAQWQTLNPNSEAPIETHLFKSKSKLAAFIDDVLQTGRSKQRINQMKALAGIPLETEVRSRRDIDAIYIVSKRDELILLKPFIDVSVSPFAAKIPLYASSRSHSADRNNRQNKELSKLIFSDNPFLIGEYDALRAEVQQAWKKQSFSTLRLFALGFDSYQLIEQLMRLQQTDSAVYKGLIGDLRLGSNNTIEAKLGWSTYQDGELVEATTPITAEQ